MIDEESEVGFVMSLTDAIQYVLPDVKVDADGKVSMTKNALCNLLGISRSTFSVSRMSSKLAERLAAIGFDNVSLNGEHLPDTVIATVIDYFAHDAQVTNSIAKQLIQAFGATGIRAYFQQATGWLPRTTATMSQMEVIRAGRDAANNLIAIYDYANNKPGLQRMVDHAVSTGDQLALDGLVTLDDILARTGREYSNEEKQVIGRYAGMSYRSLTGKAPEQVKVCRKDRSGRKQYYSVAAYRYEFVPVIENAIELGFGS